MSPGLRRLAFWKRRRGEARRRLPGWAIASLAGVGVVALALTVALLMAPRPPVDALETALAAVGLARAADAESIAPAQFAAATSALEAARRAWSDENRRWSPLRDFTQVERGLDEASRLADAATRAAKDRRAGLARTARSGLDHAALSLADFRSRYRDLPLAPAARKRAAAGELLLASAKRALAAGNVALADRDARRADSMLVGANRDCGRALSDYLAALPRWREEAAALELWSRREGAAALLVDKMARRCSLFESGRLVAAYPVDLGPNWIGDKRRRGDRATPEGRYRVTRKRDLGHTRYHRALELDYPNAEDRARFRRAQARRELAAEAAIGGLIEIHGGGGRGEDWTDGCVALSDAHMDRLFARAAVGTPVLIVGALTAPEAGRRGAR
ncbi:MAG: L,D-transpeptidase [Candidatus Krumholzibacteriia bacterium]